MARSLQTSRSMWRTTLWIFLSLWCARAADAQVFGIGALLNPEGSRLFPQPILFPRHPGKPDVRWHAFNWRYYDDVADSTKYRLYFYEAEDWTARFVLPKIHDEVVNLSRTFSYAPPIQFNYLLFTTERDFRQANVFNISEGVQGITSTEEATMAIPFWGEQQTFDHISTHEMVHQFQVQKLQKHDQYTYADRMQLIPLWFIEGMAEYYSLHGIDSESRVYLRDLAIHPDLDKGYTPPALFEDGALSFINIYKVGQAKIDFLEKKFGEGTVQAILGESSLKLGNEKTAEFRTLVSKKLNTSPEILDSEWKSWFIEHYQKEADSFTQNSKNFKPVKEAGDTLDIYDISPNGRWMLDREIDPMLGLTSIQLLDLTHPERGKTELIHDNQPNTLSLFFFQAPTIAISDWHAGYAVETSFGPELEIRNLDNPDRFKRFPLRKFKILQVQSITFSPDGRSTAFVGVTASGDNKIYVIDDFPFDGEHPIRELTHEHYSWRTLSWDQRGILAAGDRTANGKYGIFSIDPKSGVINQLTAPEANQGNPSSTDQGLLLQTWDAGPHGSPQAALITGSDGARKIRRITDLKTGVFYPRIRNKDLYFLAFEKGSYMLVKGTPGDFGTTPLPPEHNQSPWTPKIEDFNTKRIEPYKPFVSSGKRLDNLGAFFASGGFFGASATVSDLMRDYSFSAELLVLGKISQTTADAFLSSYRGRTKWTLGVYNTVQPQLDSVFPATPGVLRTYLYHEFGALGQVEYPFNAFSYTDLELRIGGANRTDYSDPGLADAWNAQNPGSEFVLAPTWRIGYDRILYEMFTGPLKGFGTLFESETNYTPHRNAVAERLRWDVANYWHLPGRTVLAFQGLGAAAFGDKYRNSFLISSDDILRAYPFNDDRLYGDYVIAGKAELRFPIGQLFGFPPLRGLVGYDLGTIFTDKENINERITSSVSYGLTLNIPPISMNFIFAHPIREAPGPQDSTVAHFTLRYLYL